MKLLAIANGNGRAELKSVAATTATPAVIWITLPTRTCGGVPRTSLSSAD
jgi:hypothetical protein